MTWNDLMNQLATLPKEQLTEPVKMSIGEGYEPHFNLFYKNGNISITDGEAHPTPKEEVVILLDDGVEDGVIVRVPVLHAVI